MARIHLGWRILTALAALSMGRSLDSVNLDLEVLSQIDLTALGTPNLDRYKASYDLVVDDSCQYLLSVTFVESADDKAADASPDFTGACDPSDSSGTAPDGKPWHAHRRNWMQFPPYVFDTTGFDHVSLYWRPCGLPPKGLRLSRFDLTFYTVLPQYRAFWTCSEIGTPSICSPNQTSTFGRGHFVVPRLERDPMFLANTPIGYNPDPLVPQAYQYDGMFLWNDEEIPETSTDFQLPQFDLASYDGDIVAFRAMLPYRRFSGPNATYSAETQFYVYQTMTQLPGGWNTTYDPISGNITVIIGGAAGICGESFDIAKGEADVSAIRKL